MSESFHIFGYNHRPRPTPIPPTTRVSSSVTYVNGVPVSSYTPPTVHAIPATAVPMGAFKLPPSPYSQQQIFTTPPGTQVIWDPVAKTYKVYPLHGAGVSKKTGKYKYNFDCDDLPPPSPGFALSSAAPPPRSGVPLTRSQSFPHNYPNQQPPQYINQPPPEFMNQQPQQFNNQPPPQFMNQQQEQEYYQMMQQQQQQQFMNQQPPQQFMNQPQPPQQFMNQQQPPQQFMNQPPPQNYPQQSQQFPSDQQHNVEPKEMNKPPLPPIGRNSSLSNPSPGPDKNTPPIASQSAPSDQIPDHFFEQTGKELNKNPTPIPVKKSSVGKSQQNALTRSPSTPTVKTHPMFINQTVNATTATGDKDIQSRNRMKSLNELVSTEESYSDSLEKLILYYKIPMENQMNELNLTQSDISTLFSNIEPLLVVSKDLLIKLKYRFTLPEEQQNIGELYIEKSKEMKMYIVYINNYDRAIDELKKIEDKHPKLFKNLQDSYKYSLDIRSLLIMPVQRIPRYELLFREILKNTSPSHYDYQNLKEAYQSIHEINVLINNNKKLSENKDRVVTISQELKGAPNSLLKSSRRWIREGVLETQCTHKKWNGTFMVYLFNDLVILAKAPTFIRKSKKMEFLVGIDLENSEFKEIQGSPTKFRFISDPEGKSPLIFTFEADSEKTKELWISDLKLLEEERKLNQLQRGFRNL
ncbi:hypothetical protein CYY_004734 [Polysphondylium violaceum]|uniref:Pleckstrin domain-containing protein n=1 Tax=Polysphondylium violaceum TaxID=133409 RepID=A0A8J4PW00_9MYCE|nr:hypothetical protein CYY_004734 [Polysphondylium violaceum]